MNDREMPKSEEALMRAYVAGDREAFARLFERLAPSVHAFFARATRGDASAEDLVQTTFLKLHRARGRWRPDRMLRPWVFTIAERVRRDAVRRSRWSTARGDEALEEADAAAAARQVAPEAELALLADARARRVRLALEALPEGQRTVIHLHRYEGLSFGEIAAVLGTSTGAVKLRAFRGYARLRLALSDLLKEAP